MKEKAEILELGARYGIEAPHTGHVARLAMDVFDGFPLDGFGKAERRLLFAAAYLHDIGYASDPQNHIPEGARILADNPVAGFSADEWNAVIGIVLLHKRDWRAGLGHGSFPPMGGKQRERVKTLGAMLRIADGLDHGHIQDAEIFYCKRGKKADKIGVECGWYDGNIPWAEGKTDLWEAVFKRPFRFEGRIERGKKLFKGVVRKSDSAVSAARRILYSQYDAMRDNVPRMLERRDLECLRDYRAAMHRFRAALRMFKPLLGETSGNLLAEKLRELSDAFGPVRDTHAACRFFRSIGEADAGLAEQLESELEAAREALRKTIESEPCLGAVQGMNRLLRIELPVLEQRRTEPPFAVFSKERLAPLMKRISELEVSGLRNGDEASMHEARKLFRRGRYHAEFAAPVLGRQTQQAAKQLKAVSGALGDVRDARLLARRFGAIDPIRQREAEAWEGFEKGWRKFVGV